MKNSEHDSFQNDVDKHDNEEFTPQINEDASTYTILTHEEWQKHIEEVQRAHVAWFASLGKNTKK